MNLHRKSFLIGLGVGVAIIPAFVIFNLDHWFVVGWDMGWTSLRDFLDIETRFFK